jgi:mitotic spindle assembly checkpoint protein MAD1
VSDKGMSTETDCSRLLLDAEKDELRVQVSTLTYELANIKQEREMEVIRFEKETRSLQLKADADFRKAQVSFTRE